MRISSWRTEGSCGVFEKVVDGSLLRLAESALLAEAGISRSGGRAMTREAVEPAEHTIQHVECVECGEVAEGSADGWKAYLGGGFEGLPLEVAAFCPTCAAREF